MSFRFMPFCLSLFAVMIGLIMGASSALARQEFTAPGPGMANLAASFGEALQPDFTRRDLLWFIQDLRLDDGQKTVVETLFADYETAFKSGADQARGGLSALAPESVYDDSVREQREREIRSQIEDLVEQLSQQPENLTREQIEQQRVMVRARIEDYRQQLREMNPEPLRGEQFQWAMAKAGESLDAWRAEKARLRDELVTNVQAILNDDQKDLWSPLSRKLTREKTLSRGRLSGESVDLFQIVAEMKFPPQVNESLKSSMAEYDVQLDAALQARNSEIERSQREMIQAMSSGNGQAAASLTQRQVKARIGVRDVNEAFTATIAGKLPSDLASNFLHTVHIRGYPRVYRTTQTQRLFSSARQLDGLEPSVRTAIDDLERAYLADLRPMNDQLREVVKANEPAEHVDRADRRVARNGGNRPANQGAATGLADPITEAFRKRSELGAKYADRLKNLLSDEQWQRLPVGGMADQDQAEARPPGGGGASLGDRLTQLARGLTPEQRERLLRELDRDGEGQINDLERSGAARWPFLDFESDQDSVAGETQQHDHETNADDQPETD